MGYKVMTLKMFKLNEQAEEADLDLDESIIGDLVELVGSEADVEAAAEAAYDDLSASFESGELEVNADDVPENLAISALVLKLVELGKLGPEEADSFIETAIKA